MACAWVWPGCVDLLSGLIRCYCGQLAGNHKCVCLWCIVNRIRLNQRHEVEVKGYFWLDWCEMHIAPAAVRSIHMMHGEVHIHSHSALPREKARPECCIEMRHLFTPRFSMIHAYSTEKFGACSILTGVIFTQLIWLMVELRNVTYSLCLFIIIEG